MIKESKLHKWFGFIDRNVHPKDFVNSGHYGMMNSPMPHSKDASKYDSEIDIYKNL